MSFLSELKNQANALQQQQHGVQHDASANRRCTELACQVALRYLQDLCVQLNVIKPPAVGAYSLDGKSSFPPLVLAHLRCDARKKMLYNQEVVSYLAVGWDLLPASGKADKLRISVNFPPELERVTQRLAAGQVAHERKEVRHPDTQKLQSYVFECTGQARGSITVTPDHDAARVDFRITAVGGFEVLQKAYPSAQVNQAWLDELAKMLVGQPSRFGQ